MKSKFIECGICHNIGYVSAHLWSLVELDALFYFIELFMNMVILKKSVHSTNKLYIATRYSQ